MKTKDSNNNSLAKVIIIAVAVCFVVVVILGILVSYSIAGHFDSNERSLIETRGLFGGRPSSCATREQAIKQVEMLEAAHSGLVQEEIKTDERKHRRKRIERC